MTRSIFVTFSRVGFHYWPTPTVDRAYLGQRHRHLFAFAVELTVDHDDREVEFHDLLDVASVPARPGRDYGPMSCEHIAAEVAGHVRAAYPGRAISVEVAEDGECGARLAWTADEAVT